MCGIAGIVGPGADAGRARAMADAQAHRGPDDAGTWAADGVALGHRRLSILDLSDAGHEPMASPDGRVVLTFNGEIYNYLELRAELDGWPWRSRTDTEVILAAWARWGPACLDHFVGMFAFALWDAERRALFCARDRLGIKPFHWARLGPDVLVASEIKGLLAGGVPARPDPDTWATYLTHGVYDHGPGTFFEGVRSLPPGHILTVDAEGRASERPWWRLPDHVEDLARLSDREAEEGLRARLDEAVRLRLRSDVPLGVNLSGGLDSGSLVTSVDRTRDDPADLQTFTAGFSDPAYDEVDFADRVPRRTRWQRYVRRLAPEQVPALADVATWHQEAPFGGVATLAYHLLHDEARRQSVTVLLEAQGVDEILAGYAYFRPHHRLDLLEAGACRALRADLRAGGATPGPVDAAGAIAAMRSVRAPAAAPVYQDGTSFLAADALSRDVVERAGAYPTFEAPFPDRLRNALYRDLRHTKLPRVLRMNDRLSMAHGRELREPFLDHRVVEFAFGLAADQRLRPGTTKDVLRRAMAGRLPDAVRCAPKRAVVTPQREWLRGPLAPWVEEILASSSFADRGLFDAGRCRERFRRFRAGEGSNAFFVWQWIGTELWFRRWVDGGGAAPTEAARACAGS